jgi:ribonuclease inhibitor
MMNVILEGKRLQDPQEAYPYLKEKLDLPDHFGENLDALYDCLTEICGMSIIRIEAMMPEESEFYRRLIRVMQDAADENRQLELRIAHGYYVEG